MIKKNVVSTLLMAVLGAASGVALAQHDPHGQDHRPGPHHSAPSHRPPPHHGPERPDPAAGHWARGDHVPQPYRGHQYVVSDWRGHHLHAPPRGYQWISTGPDYFLVGVATGVVMESVLGH
jgi:Ni/Co efflux regulator RcnB